MPVIQPDYSITNFQAPIATGFLKSVSAYPNHNALWIDNHFYTYNELFKIVLGIYNQIPSDETYKSIGIYCKDDVYSYASILAVSLYGAAYVPLNNKNPLLRNKNIVEQCDLKLIITSVKSADVKAIAGDANVLFISNSKQSSTELPMTSPLNPLSEGEGAVVWSIINQPIAYILFTSGSTGQPKAVPVSHANVNHFFNFFLKNYDFNPTDKFLQVYELNFDVSVFSFFMPLITGACCYVLPNEGIRFVKILEFMQEHKITIVSMVPTILKYAEKYLNELSFPCLRYSFFSGDPLYQHHAKNWSRTLPNAQIHNFYGPTETTIVCTRYIWNASESEKEAVNNIVPLGKSFEGMEALILDEKNQPSEKGELCFSGTQVISGYLNGTNEDKFFNYQGKRFYKTGDIASLNTNGNLIFYGRSDSQVKINGYRVELGEIEFVLEKYLKTKCVVLCLKDKNQMNGLIAFIETVSFDEQQLKDQLFETLPDYMIPHRYIAIEELPLNPNGKIDKESLKFKVKSYGL